MEHSELIHQITENLYAQFERDCPLNIRSDESDPDTIMAEYKRWDDFWKSHMPRLTDPNPKMYSPLLFIKQQICGEARMNILKQLQTQGLHKKFIAKYFQ